MVCQSLRPSLQTGSPKRLVYHGNTVWSQAGESPLEQSLRAPLEDEHGEARELGRLYMHSKRVCQELCEYVFPSLAASQLRGTTTRLPT